MTPKQLAEIKARVEAATPGEWEQSGSMIYSQNNGNICELSEIEGDGYIGHEAIGIGSPDWNEAMANATFIAHARQDVPALVAEVERLQAQNEGLREYSKGCLLKFADVNSEAALLCSAARNLIAYRDSAGALNFQLEKADDFIGQLREIVDKLD